MEEARLHELEAHRQRTSRTYSMVLLGAIFLVAGAIWLTPTQPTRSDAAAATSIATPDTSAAETAESIRFAMQSLDLANSAATPAAAAEARDTAVPVTDVATKASVAMP